MSAAASFPPEGAYSEPSGDASHKVFLRLCGWWVIPEDAGSHTVEQNKAVAENARKGAQDHQCSFPGCIFKEKHHGPHGFDEASLLLPTPKRKCGLPSKFTKEAEERLQSRPSQPSNAKKPKRESPLSSQRPVPQPTRPSAAPALSAPSAQSAPAAPAAPAAPIIPQNALAAAWLSSQATSNAAAEAAAKAAAEAAAASTNRAPSAGFASDSSSSSGSSRVAAGGISSQGVISFRGGASIADARGRASSPSPPQDHEPAAAPLPVPVRPKPKPVPHHRPKPASVPRPPVNRPPPGERLVEEDEEVEVPVECEDDDECDLPRVYLRLNAWWETPETIRRDRIWALEGCCNFPGCPLADRHSGPHQYDETCPTAAVRDKSKSSS